MPRRTIYRQLNSKGNRRRPYRQLDGGISQTAQVGASCPTGTPLAEGHNQPDKHYLNTFPQHAKTCGNWPRQQPQQPIVRQAAHDMLKPSTGTPQRALGNVIRSERARRRPQRPGRVARQLRQLLAGGHVRFIGLRLQHRCRRLQAAVGGGQVAGLRVQVQEVVS